TVTIASGFLLSAVWNALTYPWMDAFPSRYVACQPSACAACTAPTALFLQAGATLAQEMTTTFFPVGAFEGSVGPVHLVTLTKSLTSSCSWFLDGSLGATRPVTAQLATRLAAATRAGP